MARDGRSGASTGRSTGAPPETDVLLVRGASDSLPRGCANFGSPAPGGVAPPSPSMWLVPA